MQVESDTSLSLLDGLKANDELSWQRFVAIYGPAVYARCRAHRLKEADAGDVTQNVFTKVLTSIETFRTRDGQRNKFRYWLSAVITSALRDYGRNAAKTIQASGDYDIQALLNNVAEELDEEDAFSPADSYYTLMMGEALQVVRSDFSEQTWQAFWLTQVDEVPGPGVAEQLGMTNHAVRAASMRVRRRLREQLDGLFD